MAPVRGATRQTSGSPGTGEPDYLVVAKVLRPHGIHGEMLLETITDFPERLAVGTQVSIGRSHDVHTIEAVSPHGRNLRVKFEGVDSPESARGYRHEVVYVTAADRPPLPNGVYYHHQLVGCEVVDESGKELGILANILQTGANDVFVVRSDAGGEFLLPFLKSVVLQIDLGMRRIQTRIPEGMEPRQ